MKSDLWRTVIQAIENAIPEYDVVNERISLGQAMKTRQYAADQLELREGNLVLDAGIGPGTMSQTILSRNADITIVGLDASTKLLQAARERFKSSQNSQVSYVRAAFEAVPLRTGAVDRIVSAYAFRDARDRDVAIEEFRRVLGPDGCFAIVDLGKPDNPVRRGFVTIYVQYLMPFIARLSKSNRIQGNPWGMIVPTYRILSTNGNLMDALRSRFSKVTIREFLLGGAVVILAQVN
jgi:demethylmenaquinone methyltransferase/2-methoxy-6-polyprenyl-1,4-benzoquinol methylase